MSLAGLIPPQSRIIAVAAALAIAALAGAWVNGIRWEARFATQATLHATERAEIAAQLADQQAHNRAQERAWQTNVERIQTDAEQKLADAESSRVAAAARAERLQQSVERVLAGRGATCGAIATQQRQATADAVLGDVFRRIDEFAGRAAAEADRSRVAGLACSAAYDSLGGVNVPRTGEAGGG